MLLREADRWIHCGLAVVVLTWAGCATTAGNAGNLLSQRTSPLPAGAEPPPLVRPGAQAGSHHERVAFTSANRAAPPRRYPSCGHG